MNILILGDRSGWHSLDLHRAAAARGHTVTIRPWARLTGAVGVDAYPIACSDGASLDEADLVLVRTMPPGSLEQIIFRMNLLGRLADHGVRVINSPRAIEVAVDKYLALALMHAANLPVPATVVCQKFDDAVAAFDALGRDVVVKPLFGSEGFGIVRLSDPDLAQRAFVQLERAGSVIYMQRFIDHGGSDLRLFVVGDRVVAAAERSSRDWRTNVARGGKARAVTPTPEVTDLALRAARACAATIAGIDIVHDRHGQPFVLEVNAVPGWRALAPATGVDIADAVIALAGRQP